VSIRRNQSAIWFQLVKIWVADAGAFKLDDRGGDGGASWPLSRFDGAEAISPWNAPRSRSPERFPTHAVFAPDSKRFLDSFFAIVSAIFMRVNSTCAHQLRPPASGITDPRLDKGCIGTT
jgi:hypothetical protein